MITTDSKGRAWGVVKINGLPDLTPIGHDTDPDSLSDADYTRLCDLVADAEPADDYDDPVFLAYDRARDADEERRMCHA